MSVVSRWYIALWMRYSDGYKTVTEAMLCIYRLHLSCARLSRECPSDTRSHFNGNKQPAGRPIIEYAKYVCTWESHLRETCQSISDANAPPRTTHYIDPQGKESLRGDSGSVDGEYAESKSCIVAYSRALICKAYSSDAARSD